MAKVILDSSESLSLWEKRNLKIQYI